MSVHLDLSKHGPIPKRIYVSWKRKDILDNQSPVILNGIVNLKNLNPDYKFEISDDADVEQYLKEHLGTWDYVKIKNKKIVEKLDLWRLLKIYKEGGIYVDLDRYCNISFDQIIEANTKCILPTHADVDFSQDIMISCKGNPLFKKAIELNLAARYIINPRGVFHLGPPLYMKAVTKVVFGKGRKRRPGKQIMDDYRRLLHEAAHFQTYYEHVPDDTLIYKHNDKTFKKGNGKNKEEFYASQDVTPWNLGFDTNTGILIIILLGLAILSYLY